VNVVRLFFAANFGRIIAIDENDYQDHSHYQLWKGEKRRQITGVTLR